MKRFLIQNFHLARSCYLLPRFIAAGIINLWNMQSSSSAKSIGCIGKCTTSLTAEELDQITDNISKTLSNPKGRKIFRKYLENKNLGIHLECLDLYETSSDLYTKETNQLHSKESNIKSLSEDVERIRETAENLDIPEIDRMLMKQFNTALTNENINDLLNVLEATRDRLLNSLRYVHKDFKHYVHQPCPKTPSTRR